MYVRRRRETDGRTGGSKAECRDHCQSACRGARGEETVMQVVEPYAQLLAYQFDDDFIPDVEDDFRFPVFNPADGPRALRRCELFGRVSHRAEGAITVDSWRNFIQRWTLEHGDWSFIEHVSLSADLVVDRGITHEIVRHRIAAYTQESTRFVNYGKKGGEIKCVLPPPLEPVHALMEKHRGNSYGPSTVANMIMEAELVGYADANKFARWYLHWMDGARAAEGRYLEQLKMGVAPQYARDELPHKVASRIISTYDLRTWRHTFLMRTTAEAHPKYRRVYIPLLADFKQCVPLLFDDIEPLAKQSDNLKKMR